MAGLSPPPVPEADRGAAVVLPPTAKSAGGGKEERLRRVTVSSLNDVSPNKVPRSKSQTSEIRRADVIRASFKRPRSWVLIFGWSLAMCAGTVNVVAFRHWKLYVSHMTGDTTAIGMRIEGVHQGGGDFYDLREAVVLLMSFVIGCFTCGLLIDKNQVHFGGKSMYGLALIGNSILLIFATFEPTALVASCLAACACGLQNAMCTSHFGAVVRTTHVTGTVTDIGSTLGRIAMIFLRKGCRRSRLNLMELAEIGVDARKLLVLLPMWVFYLLGTIVGAYLYTLIQVKAMLVPATFTMVVGLSYCMFRQRLKHFLKKVEQERLNKELIRVRDHMERTQLYLRARQQARSSGTDETAQEASVVIELEEGFEDMLATLCDLEENIENFCHSPRSSRHGASSPRRSATFSPRRVEPLCVV